MKTGQNASSEAKMLAWGLKCSFRATSKLRYWSRDRYKCTIELYSITVIGLNQFKVINWANIGFKRNKIAKALIFGPKCSFRAILGLK